MLKQQPPISSAYPLYKNLFLQYTKLDSRTTLCRHFLPSSRTPSPIPGPLFAVMFSLLRVLPSASFFHVMVCK